MLGVAGLLLVISVMSGFDRQMRDKVLGFNAHLRVELQGEQMSDYRRVMSVVTSNKNVQHAAPYVLGQVLALVKVKWWMSSVGASPVDE